MRVYPFFVKPNLPKELELLQTLAYNFWYSWNWPVVQLFIRMDYHLWEDSYQNPVEVLSRIPQERLDELARDESFVANVEHVYEMFSNYMKQTTWFEKNTPSEWETVVAYFSCEFGIAEGLPIYSGGLGILSGDHLKSSSDLGIPLVAVGLLYQEGFFRQYLNNDGWQQERYPENNWYTMPVILEQNEKGDPLKISVHINGEDIRAQIWRVAVGRTHLFLLDTNIPDNAPHLRAITQRLYGGDRDRRIQQEMLLGVGGYRALETMGIHPTVFHMNEGHSAFLALERLRVLMQQEKRLSFKEAVEVIWASSVFTTHTPVPAGNERFSLELMQKYVKPLTDELGLNWGTVLSYGRVNPFDTLEDFCLTVLALKLSAFNNGVAKIHGRVSRSMWQGLWSDLPTDEVPIQSITNGIHSLSWISHDLRELLTRYLGPHLDQKPWESEIWGNADRIPDGEFWGTHERRRERLVFYARKRLREQCSRRGLRGAALDEVGSVLDPMALTLGFARRFATYKRGNLLFSDPDRLYKILSDPERPVQIIFAGKAHPQDTPGKEVIKTIVHFASEERFRRHIVFIEDYDINVARYLVQGCDVWINTPRRLLEASGTSGMKAAANGVLNLSILDGWWDEAFTPENATTGWAIGSGEEYDDPVQQDFVEGQALFDVLERQVIPLFYDRDRTDLPREWVKRSKACLSNLASYFNTHRMLMEYTNRMYLPAAAAHRNLAADDFKKAKALASWRTRLYEQWSQITIDSVNLVGDANRFSSGDELTIEIVISIAKLTIDDVSVQVYYGPMNSLEQIVQGTVQEAEFVKSLDGLHVFRARLKCDTSGRQGYAARIIPKNPDLVHPFMTNTVVWQKP